MEKHQQIDPEIVRKAKDGHTEALGRLYDFYITRVYRFVYFRVSSREDAEDLTEQIFVKVLVAVRAYEDRGLPFEAWLFRIARNEVTDYYRKRRAEKVPLEAIAELPDTAPDPESVTQQKMAYQEVMAALPKLPKQYREIIMLKFIDDLENDDISEVLGKPVSHIRVLQSRALAKLKKILKIGDEV